jgi:autotransporter-associated beta strand protein
MPSNSANVGRLIIAQGPVVFSHLANGGQPSGLGASAANPTNVIFYPSAKYDDQTQRPRLRYTGPAATTDRGIALGFYCDGILEACGTGPITWNGAVGIADLGNTTYGLFTLGGTNTDENTYAGAISDVGSGITLRFSKQDSGKWVLTGNVTVSYAVNVSGGVLQFGLGTSGTFSAPSITVSNGAEFDISRDDDFTFGIPITGSTGNFRKLGAGKLTLTGANTYGGTTFVDAGTLFSAHTGSGNLVVNGGVLDLNGNNRTVGTLTLNGGTVTNSTGGNNNYFTGGPYYLNSGTVAARFGGNGPIIKTNSGTVVLTGDNTALGGTTVESGTLLLNNPGILEKAVTVNGGIFGGDGTVNNNLTVNGGVVAPGSSPGTLTIAGNFALNAGGTLQVELFGPTLNSQYDQLALTGAGHTITLAGALNVLTTNSLPVGTTFVIITNAGSTAVSGTFAGHPQGSGFAAGSNWFRINYNGGSGNDVVLTSIAAPPAPSLTAQTTNGLANLTFSGTTNVNYQVLASTNLVNWMPLVTTNPPVLPFVWTDLQATNYPFRFYRVLIGL